MSLLSHDEITLLNTDSKFRNYVSSIEKALKNFESSSEWADLIASLGKLKKVLQACPKYHYIPKRISVCKRLAQCLHPALPSGVHLKALEVYTVLFQNIGVENLSKDLFLYSSGLFPLLANAALSVKPVLLGIYETYFLPLKQALRPCLIGLISGIMPGLEEGSDFYTRTFNLLKNICIAQSDAGNLSHTVAASMNSIDSAASNASANQIAEDKYFYTALWSAIVTQSSIRFPAIIFILENYEKKHRKSSAKDARQDSKSDDDQLYLIGDSIDLMINGICCCLQDSNSLVQRSVLDLINICLPLNTLQITKGDKLQLIVVAIHVVLRRDMSLNRRIYTWLMGSSQNASNNNKSTTQNNNSDKANNEELKIRKNNQNYFNTHSKKLLVSAIKMLLNNKKDQSILFLNSEDSTVPFNTNPTHSASNITSMNSASSANTNATLKIIKIVSNLVERQDIGQSIIDEILLDLLFYIYKEYCSLGVLNNNVGGGSGYLQSSHGHKRVQSVSSFATSASHQLNAQFTKEINELKKATSNFLFQSFQLYFIWDFCATKFEKICAQIKTPDESHVSPGHLCDLYEFILDLLNSAEMYNEIQTDHLPLMLKRLIQTLNTNCPKLNNQDLTKSILLCSNILKKIVPKIVVPDMTNGQLSESRQPALSLPLNGQIIPAPKQTLVQRKRSQTEFSSLKNLKRISEPTKMNQGTDAMKKGEDVKKLTSSLTNLCLNETSEECATRHVSECMNDLLTQIEANLQEIPLEESTNELETSDDYKNLDGFSFKEDDNELEEKGTNSTAFEEKSAQDVDDDSKDARAEADNNDELIFDTCVQLLKQLFYTLVVSHLFNVESGDVNSVNRAFENLFNREDYYSSSLSTQSYEKDDDTASNKNSGNFISKLANLFSRSLTANRGIRGLSFSETLPGEDLPDASSQPEDIKNQSVVVQLRSDCLSYLQSFHILNKFLIKMLFFPRENKTNYNPDPTSMTSSNEIPEHFQTKAFVINSFDNWLKVLFVLSCAAELPDNKSNMISSAPSSKLFEYQSIAINTILELIHLSESVNLHFKDTLADSLKKLAIVSFNTSDTKINKNVCFVQTVFSKKQIELIYNKSNIGNIIAQMLWSHLNNDLFNYNNQLQQFNSNNVLSSFNATDKRAGILFCLLHETLPNNLCEDIIAHNLITQVSHLTSNLTHQMDSLKRFSRLWHWSREINKLTVKDESLDSLDIFSFNLATTLTLTKSSKTFERSLLIILDILNDKRTPSALVKLIQEWLLTLICEYNDLPRILDILLVSLLHPNSARVSVQYFIHNLVNSAVPSGSLLSKMSYYNDDCNVTSDYESKVTAISSEGGHVKYHVNEPTISTKKASATQQQVFMTTSTDNNTSSSTGSNKIKQALHNSSVELPLSILNASSINNQGPVTMRINPLISVQSQQASMNSTSDYVSEFMSSRHKNENDDVSTDEYTDFTDYPSETNSAKNSQLLEKYKQMKRSQLDRENNNNNNQSKLSLESKSPSNSIPSPKKNLSDFVEKIGDENSTNSTMENPDISPSNFENEYFQDYADQHQHHQHDDENEFDEDFEDDDEDDYISNYPSEENTFDFNQFTLNHQNTSNEDSRSQTTEITLLKEGNGTSTNQNGSSSSIDNTITESDLRSLKKAKRKSELIMSTTKQDQLNTQHQKSLSLSNQPSKKIKKSPLRSAFKRDNSAPNSQMGSSNNTKALPSDSNTKVPAKATKKDFLDTSRLPTSTRMQQQHQSHINSQQTNKPIGHTASNQYAIDAVNSVDPNYSYMLLYKNCNNMQSSLKDQLCDSSHINIKSSSNTSYDHVRTLFILRCIEQILDKCSKEFLTSITHNHLINGNNKSGSSYSVHNEKLLDLIVRHLRSIYGNSFYTSGNTSVTKDLNFNLKNVTYIEAIMLVLLFYIRSYYPPSSFTLITAADGQMKKSDSNISLNTTSSTNTSQCSTSGPSSADTGSADASNSSSTMSQGSQQQQAKKNLSDFYDEDSSIDHDEKLFNENRNVQIYCLQIISKMIRELTGLCKNTHSALSVNNQGLFMPYSSHMSNQQAFYQPIIDLLDRCKLQKTLLHCFYSTINTPMAKGLAASILSNTRSHFSSMSFNSTQSDVNYELVNCRKQIQYSYMSELMEALENLIQLERLLNDFQTLSKIYRGVGMLGMNSMGGQPAPKAMSIVTFSSVESKNGEKVLEDDLLLTINKKLPSVQNNIRNKLASSSGSSVQSNNPQMMTNSNTANLATTPTTCRYITNQSICNQSMFISCTLHYLKNINLVDYHLSILKLVRNSLPSAGNALKPLSTFVSEQLCRNLLQITNGGNSSSSSGANYLVPTVAYMSAISSSINIPDLIISIMKQLSYILHYCLLNTSFLSSNMQLMYSNDLNSQSFMNQFMSSLPGAQLTETQIKQLKQFQAENETYLAQAKESLLNLLPSILSHMTQVWQRCNVLLNSNNAVNILFDQQQIHSQQQQQQQHQYSWILGHPILIKQCITEMLNPIAQYHSVAFMTAIGNVWGEKRKRSKLNQEHKVIIELVRSLKSFSISTILQNVTDILKQTNQTKNKEKKKSPSNVWLLQFLHSYLEHYSTLVSSKTDASLLNADFTSNLCRFFKETMLSTTTSNLAPACYFQLFRILHDSVNNFSTLVDDKNYVKDIQDATHKLFELCNSIVASSLQQTTWLRKNYAVKLISDQQSAGISNSVNGDPNSVNGSVNVAVNSTNKIIFGQKSDNEVVSGSDQATNAIDQLNANGDLTDTTSNLSHSLQALNILAEYLAKTLDIVYKSDEKDRLVIPLLTNLMVNLWPYLKTHSMANKNNFRAASHLLMSLTVYPYTRKTWKKEVYDMLFDNIYFYVDSATLDYCKAIIDNLISNDRSMFKDVLIRVTYQQSGGLFTSKEQESEQKAQLLKRLAFVIYSSEKDQYQKNMPEIQECIAHVLKLIQSPNLYSTLFLLFRILLLRISSRHLIALWPTILSELIVILLQMEQDLTEDPDARSNSKTSFLDHIGSVNSHLLNSNAIKLQIYLAACKLIDLILTLPSTVTNQFQLYKWSFINTSDALNLKQKDQFVPYLLRISNLLKAKFPNVKTVIYKTNGGPLIRNRQIQSLGDLRQFFDIVTSHAFVHSTSQSQNSQSSYQAFPSAQQNSQFINRQFEAAVHEDFLEGWIQ